MSRIRTMLHAKRSITEEHIRKLEQAGRAGERYTATMPDVPFLVLGLICDAGWLIQVIAGIIYLTRHALWNGPDILMAAAHAVTIAGIGWIIYLNRIHEKEIATRLQKNLGFGMVPIGGMLAGVFGIVQATARYAAGFTAAAPLMWVIAGGAINFLAGIPIFLSFKKGIRYGIR